MSTDADLVTVSVDRGVALLTWNRPERHNAWTVPLEQAYFAALRVAEADTDVRAIVVTGAGRSFCAGMDAQALGGIADGTKDTNPQDRQPATYPASIAKPIVAAINGACAGIGLMQALVCDVRFAAAGVKLTTSFARRGIMAEHATAWLLPRIVGMGNARDLLLSGRVVLAEEALQLGLVNRVYPAAELLPAALDYAADLAANCSPLAMATMKTQLDHATDQSMEQARLEGLGLWTDVLKPHPDFAEGIASFVERRAPVFAPLPPDRTPPQSGAS